MPQIVTWNMQGCNADGVNLWYNYVFAQLLNNNNPPDVIALQESGDPPTGETFGAIDWLGPPPPDVYAVPPPPTAHKNSRPSLTAWNCGTDHDPTYYYVLWLHTDSAAATTGRVNLAILSRFMPNHCIYSDPLIAAPVLGVGGAPGVPGFVGRAAIGFVFDAWNLCVFSIHANSGNGGGDIPTLITNIQTWMAAHRPGHHWIVAGDYNRQPAAAAVMPALPAGVHVYGPNGPTHNARTPLVSEYDYAMGDVGVAGPALVGTVMQIDGSDHYPVHYNI